MNSGSLLISLTLPRTEPEVKPGARIRAGVRAGGQKALLETHPEERELQERELQVQYLRGEKCRTQNLRPAQFFELEESRPLISSNGIVGLRRFHQVEQVAVRRIDSLMLAR